jgi:predicted AlkP superfamily pyrophosphatase or phosphodiesterase
MKVLCRWIFFAWISAAGWAAPLLVISIDGLRPDYITQADAHGIKAPNLRRFLTDGAYANSVVGVVPTITYPSHTTLLTGVAPALHHILGNLTFDPLMKNREGWYWYAQDIKTPTLWEAAGRVGLVTASVSWPVSIGAPGVRYLIPEFGRAGTAEDRKLLAALSRPDGYFRELEEKLGRYTNGVEATVEGDRIRTRFAIEILTSKKAGLLTIHLSSLDESQHDTGPFSKEDAERLEQLDEMVGRLAAAARSIDPNAVIAVVSDHGFIGTDHRVNLMAAFTREGLVKLSKPDTRSGSPTVDSWEASPWMYGGSAAIILNHPDDRVLKARVKQFLDRLASDPANGIARLVEADELRKMGGNPDAAWLIEFQPGYQTGTALSGPLVTDAPGTGSHGYLPTRPEMRASFFVIGKSIAKKQLGQIDLRQVAPTLALILGVPLSTAEMPALDLKAK